MFPQTKEAIVEYYQRLNNISGGNLAKIYFGKEKSAPVKTVKAISAGFSSLNTFQVQELMDKYHASYFFTEIEHHLDLPVAHVSAPYILYDRQVTDD